MLSWERRRLAGSYSALQKLIANNHANCRCSWVNSAPSTLPIGEPARRRRSQEDVIIHVLQGSLHDS
jgi:hypothetical protein